MTRKQLERLREKERGYDRKRRQTPKRKAWTRAPEQKFQGYQRSAKKRAYDFRMTFEEFVETITKPCEYCKTSNAGGVDRRNNEPYYDIANAVPCCWKCNKSKSTEKHDDFIAQCKRIVVARQIYELPSGARLNFMT